MASLLRPLAGGLAGAGSVLLGQMWLAREEAAAPDVTYQEPADPLATGRAAQILRFGAPREGVAQPLVYRNHVLGWDSGRRVPRWVAEHLSRELVDREQVADRKGVSFGPDPSVPGQWSSDNKDYWGSGWSRGHMAPAGNNKHCQESMKDTFMLTNVVPQDMDNNGGYWNRLEIYCRGLAKRYSDVWVTSGPLWLPVQEEQEEQEEAKEPSAEPGGRRRRVRPPRPRNKTVTYPVIGANGVCVPTHLYKVVVVTDPALPAPLLAAFVVPNRPVHDTHLAAFKVELSALEHDTGLAFLPGLDRAAAGDLCLEDGCNLQNYKEFQQFSWRRRLASPWHLKGLEKDWAEAGRQGVAGPDLEQVYRDSKERLQAKETRNQTNAAATRASVEITPVIAKDSAIPAVAVPGSVPTNHAFQETGPGQPGGPVPAA